MVLIWSKATSREDGLALVTIEDESSGCSPKADPMMVGKLAALFHADGWWPKCGWEKSKDTNSHSCMYLCNQYMAARRPAEDESLRGLSVHRPCSS